MAKETATAIRYTITSLLLDRILQDSSRYRVIIKIMMGTFK